MTRRIALALLICAALLGAGATAAYADDVTVTVKVPTGAGSPSPSTTPAPPPGGGNLPDTGRPILLLIGAAAVLIVAGAGLMALSRRSASRPH